MELPTQQERRNQASIDSSSASSKSKRSDQSGQHPQKDRQQMGLALAGLAPSLRAVEAFHQAELAPAPVLREMATLSRQQMGLALAGLAPSLRAVEAFHQLGLASVAIHAGHPLETSLLASMEKELSANNSERVARLSSRPSWLLTSQAILRGDSSFNLGWDILASLHEPPEAQPGTFATLVQMVEAADAGTEAWNTAVEAGSKFYSAFYKILHKTLTAVNLFASKNIIIFALMIIGVYLSYAQLQETREQTRIATESSGQSIQTRDELTKQIEQFSADQDAIRKQLEEHSRDKGLMAIVEPTFLRNEPDVKGKVIQKIFPDEMVKIIRLDREWGYVEIFDYKEMQLSTGWIMRRYLRPWHGR